MKYSYIKNLILIPLVILFIGGTQIVRAQDTLKIELIANEVVDVCGIEKRLTIEVQTNEIYAKDSLQGYTLIIEYDPSKILIEQGLSLNTLTNQIVSAGGDVYYKLLEPGVYRVDAFLPFGSNVFIKGKLPLIVFSGKYIGQCEGIASLKIYEFEPAFYSFGSSKILEYSSEKYIKGEVADVKGRELKVRFASDSVEIGKQDSIKEMDVFFQFQSDSKISSANVKFSVSSHDLLNIQSILSAQSDIKIDTVLIDNDTMELRVSFRQNFQTSLPALKLKLKSIKNDNFTSEITAEISGRNSCNCVKTVTGDILNVVKIKADTSVSVDFGEDFNKNFSLVNGNDELRIISTKSISIVTLYNLIGIPLQKLRLDYPSFEVSLPQNEIQNGIYIIEVVTNAENKRNYIKFIK